MTMDVKAAVKKSLAKYCEPSSDVSKLGGDISLQELNLDSLDVLELIYDLEEQFGVELEASQLKEIETLSQLIAVFEVHVRQAA